MKNPDYEVEVERHLNALFEEVCIQFAQRIGTADLIICPILTKFRFSFLSEQARVINNINSTASSQKNLLILIVPKDDDDS